MRKYYFSLRSNLLLLAFASLLFTFNQLNAQVGIGTTSPNAMLDIHMDQPVVNGVTGFLVPRVSTMYAGADTNGDGIVDDIEPGLMVFYTGSEAGMQNTFYVYHQVHGWQTVMEAGSDPCPTAAINNYSEVEVLTCENEFIILSASGVGSYTWKNGNNDVLGNEVVLVVTEPDTYTLEVTKNGCTDSVNIEITENITTPEAAINSSNTELSCSVTSITLTASGGGSYEWSTGADTAEITLDTPGTYTVTVTGANGCTDIESIEINETPNVELGSYDSVNKGIVVWVDPDDCDHYKLISMNDLDDGDPTDIKHDWSENNGIIGANSENDGMSNTVAWINRYNQNDDWGDDTDAGYIAYYYDPNNIGTHDGWYLPAPNEWLYLESSSEINLINQKLSQNGGDQIIDGRHYWTSREDGEDKAYAYHYKVDDDPPGHLHDNKNRGENYYVRAFKEIGG
jgi:hypothetical protein